MALAENLTDSISTKTIKLAHTAATVKNTIYLLAGRVLVATLDKGANEANIFIHKSDKVEFPKEPALAIAAGATVYWDNVNSRITTVTVNNTKCGIAVEAAAAADSKVNIELDNGVNY